jgi:hypothetical protein
MFGLGNFGYGSRSRKRRKARREKRRLASEMQRVTKKGHTAPGFPQIAPAATLSGLTRLSAVARPGFHGITQRPGYLSRLF